MEYLNRSISLFDAIFNTDEWKKYQTTMNDLQRQRRDLKESYARTRAELKENKTNLKEHKKEAKAAEKAVRKVPVPTDPGDR